MNDKAGRNDVGIVLVWGQHIIGIDPMDILHIRIIALSFCVRNAKKRQHGNCICLGLYIVSIHPILGYTFLSP